MLEMEVEAKRKALKSDIEVRDCINHKNADADNSPFREIEVEITRTPCKSPDVIEDYSVVVQNTAICSKYLFQKNFSY